MIVCSQSSLNNVDKSSPSNFSLIFPKIPTETIISAINPFKLNIFSAVLPSVTLSQEDLSWQSNKTKRASLPMDFDSWIVSYMIDSQLSNWRLLFNWMSYINNNYNKMAELHSNYSVDCSLIVTDNYTNLIMEVVFVSVWPSNLGEVSFSYREGDINLESTVTFNYDHYYIKS